MLELYCKSIKLINGLESSPLSSLDQEEISLIPEFETLVEQGLIVPEVEFLAEVETQENFNSLLATFIAGIYSGKAECVCHVSLFSERLYFSFQRTIQSRLTLGPLALDLDKVSMRFSVSDESSELWPQITYYGSIRGDNKNLLSFSIDFDLYYKGGTIIFTDFPTLSRWIEITGLDYLGDYFPRQEGLDSLLSFKLSHLEILFVNASEAIVPQISLGIDALKQVNIIDGLVSFEPSLALDLYDPFGVEAIAEGELKGRWNIGETQLETRLLYPSREVYAGMVPGETLDVDAVARQFFPAVDWPDITIGGMEFRADSRSKIYSVNLDVTSSWVLRLSDSASGLELQNVTFSLLCNSKDDEKICQYDISGQLEIAGINIYISALHDDGWEFQGSTGYGQAIPIGALVEDIVDKFGAEGKTPDAIANLTLQNIDITFNTRSKDFFFTCNAQFPIEGKDFDIVITITKELDESDNAILTFGGLIYIDSMEFNIVFSKQPEFNAFIATYRNPDGDALVIRSLVNSLSDSVAAYVPENLSITLNDALFVYRKDNTAKAAGPSSNSPSRTPQASSAQSRGNSPSSSPTSSQSSSSSSTFLLGLNLGSAISLSDLPLVGKEFPPEEAIAIDDLQLIVASQSLSAAAVNELNTLIPPTISPLPIGDIDDTSAAIRKGFNATAQLQLGDIIDVVSLPITDSTTAATDSEPAVEPEGEETSELATASDQTQWFTVQRAIGPVYFDRLGLDYQAKVLWFRLDMALSGKGLTLTMDGLSFGSPLEDFKPEFDLRGIGIDYKSGKDLEISGAFLRTVIDGQAEYSGAAILKAKTFTLAAIGSYTELDGHPSLFIYAFLDKVIGGPTFFFVTGLAAGFGYNRRLIRPSLDGIRQFPLVQMAMDTGGNSDIPTDPAAQAGQLTKTLGRLQSYIPPASGEIFLAVGVKFNSFKIIDSFALLIASLGQKFRLTLLGISKIVVPPDPSAGGGKGKKSKGNKGKQKGPVTPIAEVQIALKADFVPDEGALRVDGKIIPGSYILSKKCTLSGGFAFYSWFSGQHSGDFVLTVGGYHPRFPIPQHYPRCDRLSLHWQVDSHLTIKGQAYFALTSSAVMAGGRLEATWQKGDLKAWFIAIADFLIAWKPYYYDIELSLSIGASYTFNKSFKVFGKRFRIRKTFSTSVNARLHLWGPDFTGTARISWSVISFTVKFGSSNTTSPQPLDWAEFKQSFLPEAANVCTLAVQRGLMDTTTESPTASSSSVSSSDYWRVDPKTLVFAVNSVIPFSHNVAGERLSTVGIGPMAIAPGALNSQIRVTITRNESSKDKDITDQFSITPLPAQTVPSGLWGSLDKHMRPRLNAKPIQGHCGFEIRPGAPTNDADEPRSIPSKALAFNPDIYGDAFQWCDRPVAATPTPTPPDGVPDVLRELGDRFGLNPNHLSVGPDSIIRQELMMTAHQKAQVMTG